MKLHLKPRRKPRLRYTLKRQRILDVLIDDDWLRADDVADRLPSLTRDDVVSILHRLYIGGTVDREALDGHNVYRRRP